MRRAFQVWSLAALCWLAASHARALEANLTVGFANVCGANSPAPVLLHLKNDLEEGSGDLNLTLYSSKNIIWRESRELYLPPKAERTVRLSLKPNQWGTQNLTADVSFRPHPGSGLKPYHKTLQATCWSNRPDYVVLVLGRQKGAMLYLKDAKNLQVPDLSLFNQKIDVAYAAAGEFFSVQQLALAQLIVLGSQDPFQLSREEVSLIHHYVLAGGSFLLHPVAGLEVQKSLLFQTLTRSHADMAVGKEFGGILFGHAPGPKDKLLKEGLQLNLSWPEQKDLFGVHYYLNDSPFLGSRPLGLGRVFWLGADPLSSSNLQTTLPQQVLKALVAGPGQTNVFRGQLSDLNTNPNFFENQAWAPMFLFAFLILAGPVHGWLIKKAGVPGLAPRGFFVLLTGFLGTGIFWSFVWPGNQPQLKGQVLCLQMDAESAMQCRFEGVLVNPSALSFLLPDLAHGDHLTISQEQTNKYMNVQGGRLTLPSRMGVFPFNYEFTLPKQVDGELGQNGKYAELTLTNIGKEKFNALQVVFPWGDMEPLIPSLNAGAVLTDSWRIPQVSEDYLEFDESGTMGPVIARTFSNNPSLLIKLTPKGNLLPAVLRDAQWSLDITASLILGVSADQITAPPRILGNKETFLRPFQLVREWNQPAQFISDEIKNNLASSLNQNNNFNNDLKWYIPTWYAPTGPYGLYFSFCDYSDDTERSRQNIIGGYKPLSGDIAGVCDSEENGILPKIPGANSSIVYTGGKMDLNDMEIRRERP